MKAIISDTRSISPGLLWCNLILMLLGFIGGICYAALRTLDVKILASLCFFVLGCVNTISCRKHTNLPRRFISLLLAALFIGFAADIILELHFLAGAAVFALGHLFYFAAFSQLIPISRRDMLPCAASALFILSIILFLPLLDFGSAFMQRVVLAYALIIAMMLGKAISNEVQRPCALNCILLIGSALFFFSDFMLLFAYYADAGRIANILCLLTYYPGQVILAHSLCRKL